jgi:hypothetical protein
MATVAYSTRPRHNQTSDDLDQRELRSSFELLSWHTTRRLSMRLGPSARPKRALSEFEDYTVAPTKHGTVAPSL